MGRAGALLVTLALCAPGLARAQPQPEPRPRSGLLLEGELGLAVLSSNQSFSDPLDAFGATAVGHLGGFLSPRTTLFVLAGITGGDAETNAGDIVSMNEAFLGVGFRFWLTRRLWAEASLSTARLGIREEFGETLTLPGARFALAGGYTIFEGQRLDLDGRLGFAGGGYDTGVDSASMWLSVGLTTK